MSAAETEILLHVLSTHGPALRARARGIVRDAHVAEDLVQEAVSRLVAHPPRSRTEASFAGLLRGWVHGPNSVEVADCFDAQNARYLAALDPETVRSLIQDAKIGRLAREVRSARVYAAAEQSRLFDDDSIQGAPYYEAHRAATAVVDKAIESLDAALRSEESSRGR